MKHILLKHQEKPDKRKKNIFKRMLASLVVTGVVVGSYIAMQGDDVHVEIIQLNINTNSLYYEIFSEDNDNLSETSTLLLILESESDSIEIPLEFGIASGNIVNLSSATTYTLKIVLVTEHSTRTLLTRTFTTNEFTHLNITY